MVPKKQSQQGAGPKREPDQDTLVIDEKQNKLLQNALRIKIMHALSREPMTSKQVADLIRQTPGNVHYHIQRLYEGGLLELADTRSVSGIVEKYYLAKASHFHYPGLKNDDEWDVRRGEHEYYATRLDLSEEEAVRFSREIRALLEKWERSTAGGREYGVSVRIGRIGDDRERAAEGEF
ncbi:winged helix-turn-helix domain-containing protein [Saccharibacillus sp. CPCC 101409]|uniref:ArsR/SmtB family transcription factor n=1 Tax=Saccharibacillus sp. CPCC 101409 TaxID=3058041 RepID=UPI002670FECC|nr:winged helix-turn-helix domain-containing protein [Saccharibacillus sp. CPCC 101409]MDO3410271.1 winged helix-turn-helix domain-containing protein [Saccharibacillus sp. CPCC 101409]